MIPNSARVFLSLVWPCRISISDFLTFKVLESNLIKLSFALPFSGVLVRCAFREIEPSSATFSSESLLVDEFVMALTKIVI